MRLDVRPQSESMIACITSGAIEIALEPVEVDHGYGRFEIRKKIGHGTEREVSGTRRA